MRHIVDALAGRPLSHAERCVGVPQIEVTNVVWACVWLPPVPDFLLGWMLGYFHLRYFGISTIRRAAESLSSVDTLKFVFAH